MAQTIIIKNGTGTPGNSDVVKGELAINTNTGNLYYGNTAGNVSSSFTFGDVTASKFVGDGSGITGVTGEWDGSHTGNAVITGNLTSTGNSQFGNASTDTHLIEGSLTASNDISSSGVLSGTRIRTTAAGNIMLGSLAIGANNMVAGLDLQVTGRSNFYSDISSSGAVSASGNIIAHGSVFGSRIYQQGTLINNIFSPIAGSSNITTVGTIGTGTWNGEIIAEAKLQNQSGTNTGDEDLSAHALSANVSSSFALQSNVSSSFAQSANVSASFAPIASPSFTGNITASGDISASGIIYSDNEEVLYNGSFRATTTASVNWVGPDQKGPTDYTWDKDYGVSGEGSHTMAHRYYLNAGHMVPYDCILTGFQSALRNHNSTIDSNGAVSMSLWYRLDANMDWNDSGANQNKDNILFACGNGYGHGDAIRAYNSYKVEASCAIHLTKGSMIWPRVMRTDNSAAQDGSGTGGGNTDGTYNIFIKRRKS